jgi:hypothetical protein
VAEQGELLPECQVFEGEVGAGSERRSQGAQQSEYDGHCPPWLARRSPTVQSRDRVLANDSRGVRVVEWVDKVVQAFDISETAPARFPGRARLVRLLQHRADDAWHGSGFSSDDCFSALVCAARDAQCGLSRRL